MNKETIKQLIWDEFWDKDGNQKFIDNAVDDIYDKVFEPLLAQVEYWETETKIARNDLYFDKADLLTKFADYLKQQGVAVLKIPSKDKQCPCEYCSYDNAIDEALKEFLREE